MYVASAYEYYYINSFFFPHKLLHCCSITVVCIFSPPLPLHQPNPPPSLASLAFLELQRIVLHILIFMEHASAGQLLEFIENYDYEYIICFWFLLFCPFLNSCRFSPLQFIPVFIGHFYWNVQYIYFFENKNLYLSFSDSKRRQLIDYISIQQTQNRTWHIASAM